MQVIAGGMFSKSLRQERMKEGEELKVKVISEGLMREGRKVRKVSEEGREQRTERLRRGGTKKRRWGRCEGARKWGRKEAGKGWKEGTSEGGR